MNSSMVKPEKFDHLQLVYHFTVALKVTSATKVFFALNEFFYLWGKNVSLLRYLDKICDVIIGIAKLWNLNVCLFILNPNCYQSEN